MALENQSGSTKQSNNSSSDQSAFNKQNTIVTADDLSNKAEWQSRMPNIIWSDQAFVFFFYHFFFEAQKTKTILHWYKSEEVLGYAADLHELYETDLHDRGPTVFRALLKAWKATEKQNETLLLFRRWCRCLPVYDKSREDSIP